MFGGLCPNILDFKNVSGGWGYANKFYGLKKIVEGEGYAQIFHRLENCWGGGMPTNFMDLKKCWWGGGGVMPKYFMDLKKMLGGLCQNILWT